MNRQQYIKTLTMLKELLEWKQPLNSAALQYHLILEATEKGLITKIEHAELVKECRS